MIKQKIFTDFPPVSEKTYKQKIQVDLKGADYNDTLVWKSPEGIHVKPFYHREDLENNHSSVQAPKQWFIGEDIFILDSKKSVTTALNAISNGTEAMRFIADKAFDIDALLEPLAGKEIPLHFELRFLGDTPSNQTDEFVKALIEKSGHYSITSFLNIDPIGNLASDGNWYQSAEKDYEKLQELLTTKGNILTVDTAHYQNAGATSVQQLAYGLAHVNEYLNFAETHKLSIDSIRFKVAVGSNYFFEIAKLRALRMLFDLIKKEYTVAVDTTCHILAKPTRRNKTIYDYNTNMLRSTTECMSAILGGADTIINRPYDDLYHKANAFGQRISRNQLIILKKESYFDAVSNPADGTYYIESLTQELASKALSLFKEIEASGGFLQQLKEGTIQKKVKESAQKEQDAFNNGEHVLLGTNIHPNPQDKMKNELELFPFVKQNPRKTILEPIIARRLAETIEQERLDSEV